jgi:hypothetical protein
MNKSDLLNAYNNHIVEFFEDIIKIFPDNVDIQLAKTSLITIRKVNPKLIIRIWKDYIYDKYNTEIGKGNINFFIEKDYTEDLKYTENTASILEKIATLRKPIKEMRKEDLDKSIQYMQNLCKLCNMYYL